MVSNFVTQALRGLDLTICGDGSQTRSLCYVDDMIDALISLMDSAESFQGPVNLGNPVEATVLDIASEVRRLAGAEFAFVFEPRPADDPEQLPRHPVGQKTSGLGAFYPHGDRVEQDRRLFFGCARLCFQPGDEPRPKARRSLRRGPGH